MPLVIDAWDETASPAGRQLGQQSLCIGMAAGVEGDGVGRIKPNLSATDTAQFRQSTAMPGQIQPLTSHQPPIGQGCIGEQQVTAEHQIKALILKGQIG